MADNTSTPMSLGTIILIVIVAGAAIGALLGILRNMFGGPAWLTGALAGALVGGLAQVLYRRRARALERANR